MVWLKLAPRGLVYKAPRVHCLHVSHIGFGVGFSSWPPTTPETWEMVSVATFLGGAVSRDVGSMRWKRHWNILLSGLSRAREKSLEPSLPVCGFNFCPLAWANISNLNHEIQNVSGWLVNHCIPQSNYVVLDPLRWVIDSKWTDFFDCFQVTWQKSPDSVI